MSIKSILSQCVELNIKLLKQGDSLKVDAPKGSMKPELLADIKSHKQALLDFLEEHTSNEQNGKLAHQYPRLQSYRLSSGQSQMWFLDRTHQGMDTYHYYRILHLRGEFSVDTLTEAFNRVIRKHSVLRTVYRDSEAGLTQHIIPDAKLVLQQADIYNLSYEGEGSLEQLQQDFKDQGFDLTQDLMIRAFLIRTERDGYQLHIKMHHIATDGWSIGLVVKDLTESYREIESSQQTLNQEEQQTEQPYQYIDYAYWQQAQGSQDSIAQNLEFFSNYLQNAPLLHDLPVSARGSALYRAKTVVSTISKQVSQQLTQYCKHHNVTKFSVLQFLAAWVISRFSNNNDIVMGVPVANRDMEELSGIVGYFVNTLPVRTKIHVNQNLSAALQQHNSELLDVLSRQNVPLDEVVRQLAPLRSETVAPLVQILFSLQNNDVPQLTFGNTQIEVETPRADDIELDLDIECLEEDGQLIVNWTFAQQLFSEKLIRTMASSFEQLLQMLPDNAQTQMTDLEMLPNAELQYLLEGLQPPQHDVDKNACIHQFFEQQVEVNPHKIALRWQQQQISYEQLNTRSNKLAHYLRSELKITPDTRVGICADRSFDMVVAILATLKAGGAYVPLDPNYPAERLDYMLQDASPAVILTQSSLTSLMENFGGPVVQLDKDNVEAYSQSNISPSHIGLNSRHLAYVIYTSGSTGKPKGVMIEHRSLVNYLEHTRMLYQISENDNVLQFSSASFDIFVEEFFGALCLGATLTMRDEMCLSGLRGFTEFCAAQNITLVSLPTAFWSQLLASQDSVVKSPLRTVIVGGEALSALTVQLHYELFASKVQLLNTYGPTEATITATSYLTKETDGNLTNIPIGKGNINNQLFILDDNQKLTPFGCTGELYIGGAGLARGYLNRPDLTAERFIENPLILPVDSNGSSQRLYRSGDLACYLADGNIAFLGRTDEQVKIRGFRIEPAEVEARLSNLPSVASSLVLATEVSGSLQLVAYVQPIHLDRATPDSEVQTKWIAELKIQLKQQLPDYMVPSLFVVLKDWPLTTNGKIDKKALPEAQHHRQQQNYIAPETAVEKSLVQIWALLLNIVPEAISNHADFFELGGHSLLSVRLVSEVRRQFQVELPVQSIFDNAQLCAQASLIEQGTKMSQRPPLVKVPRSGESVELSFAQQRLLFIDRLQGGSPEYNMPLAFDVLGNLDLSLLTRVFETILSRHEVLRSVFPEQSGQSQQRIRPMSEVNFAIEQVDISHLEGEQRKEEIQTRVLEEAHREFDLRTDTMLRVLYLRNGQDDLSAKDSGVLVLNMHHIASDGWSLDVLIREFFTLFNAYSEGVNNPLPPLSIQYADYAQWQREYLQDELLEEQLDYWSHHLAELPPLHSLPTDFVRPEHKQHDGALVNGHLSQAVVNRLESLARSHQLTPFMLLQGALSLLLSRHSHSHDIVTGTPVANRMRPELEPLIGFFVNTLVLRVDTRHDTVSEFLAHVRQVHLEAQSHQDVPFEQLVERLKVPRSVSHSPLFQIMVTINSDYGLNEGSANDAYSVVDNAYSVAGTLFTPSWSDFIQAKFDLEVHFNTSENGLDIYWNYDQALFKSDSVESLNRHFCRLLESFSQIENPNSGWPNEQLASLVMLSAEEADHLLYELNDTHFPYDKYTCIHEWFEQQVAKQPDATAVVFEARSLSYKQLNHRANQLAHYLRINHKVTPDTLVGLYVERSVEMVVGILGILKAGGAYVPLDPGYPAERLGNMLSDASPSVVLSQPGLSSLLHDFNGAVLVMDESESLSEYPHTNLSREETGLSARHLAYVIYTSGSTGKPKGVMVEHQALFNRIHWMHRQYGLRTTDRVLQKTPYSFDVSVWEFVWTLAAGATLVLPRPDGHKDPEYLCNIIQRENITRLHFVPSMLGGVLEHPSFRQCVTLQQVYCSGEALQLGHVRRFHQVLPSVELHNLYGPTEAAIDVSSWDCRQDLKDGVPIGKPIDNIQLLILDDKLNLVPKGAIGELYIGGDGLARGYLNRKELTAERFITNPFYDQTRLTSSSRLYKTGDLVRLRADGNIEYQGRTDHQVKIRGLRIELGEIEHQFGEIESVDSALVMASDIAGSAQLLAYIKPVSSVAVASQTRWIEQVKGLLKRQLPDYMVPGIIVAMTEWPLTSNGKINRKALPEPQQSALSRDYVAPKTAEEKLLVQIWAELLSLPQQSVSTTANFFELGGHSLLVPAMISRLDTLDKRLTIADIYHAQTLQSVAQAMQQATKPVSNYSAASLVPANADALTPEMFDLVQLSDSNLEKITATVSGGMQNIADVLPLLTLQQGFLFQHMADPEQDPCWQSIFLKIAPQHLPDLVSAINQVIQRHDSLSSVYLPLFPVPVSVVLRQYQLRVDVHELDSTQPAYQQVEALSHEMGIDELPPILLVAGEDKSNNEMIVKLMTHHLMLDQVGASVVLQEVMAILSGKAQELNAPVPHRRILAYIFDNTDNDAAVAFFTEKLKGISRITSVAGITQATFSQRFSAKEAYIDSQIEQKIRALSKAQNASGAVLFHSVFALLMSLFSGRKDVVFGSVFSGRQTTPPGSENAVGMFMNTLPFRVQIDAKNTQQLFDSVKQTLLGYLSHEHFSLDQARKLTDLDVGDSLINGVFNFRRGFKSLGQSKQITLLDDEDKMGTTSPIILAVTDEGDGFYVTLKVDDRINVNAVWHVFHNIINNFLQSMEITQSLSALSAEDELLSDYQYVSSSTWFLSHGGERNYTPTSFVAKTLSAIWLTCFDMEEHQISQHTSLWESRVTPDIAALTATVNSRFELTIAQHELSSRHTLGQQVSFITKELVTRAPQQGVHTDNTKEFGVI